jgi:uncharacterized protein (TIGR03000 family)
MTVFKKALIVVPVALLMLAGDAYAQRIRVGVGAGYGGYGYPGYGYGYRPYGYGYPGYGYGYAGPGVTVGFGSGRYGAVISSPAYGYPAYGYPAYSYPAYSTWSGGYYQPVVRSYATPAYTVSPTYPTGGVVQTSGVVQTGGVVQAGGTVVQDSGIVQASSVSTAAAPAKIEVTVPADAEVWFNGEKNTDAGEQRKFVSKELQPGMPHTFTMTIRQMNNGQEMTREFTVPMQPGEDSKMDARPLLD